ncbi:amidohydrolase [Streptomyces sp. NRRL S-340]|uniref:amidohydrolase n=1 Tax=Streptomyces sp. NRRL S-340 TaxID=1463901 RepID=UPI000565050D|nr:amidohydrolase [Streptomyces sp. NRRL S-340]
MPSSASPRPDVHEVPDYRDLAGLYRDLHAHPELAFCEHRTAQIVAERLRAAGYETTSGVGGTGVVGLLRNGAGPTVALRADMDALPVEERTGLPYASTARAADGDGDAVPLMHACGHDMHVSCLLGAAARLAADRSAWRGTLLLVFQPAEEVGRGAGAMIDDGLFERFARPDVVLGQHVAPLPAGHVGLHGGPAFAASDSLRVVLHGSGGHGSRPEACVDPVLMAAATVLRLQGIVAREVAGTSTAVVTVGALHAGNKPNVIADRAELLLTVRTFEPAVRTSVLRAVERIVRAEAAASGAPRDPEITVTESFPAVVNDPEASERTRRSLAEALGGARVVDPGPATGSEDVGMLAKAAGAPCVYWLLGGADPADFAAARTFEEFSRVARALPSNHSPLFAPVVGPTLRTGVTALTAAARSWLGRTDTTDG